MQIDRHAQTRPTMRRAFCPLECTDCRGMCLALYLMLTRDEQDEMCRRQKTGAVVLH